MADQTFSFEIKVDAETGALSVMGEKIGQLGEKAKQTETSFAGLSKEAGGLLKSVLPFATAGGIVKFFSDSVKEAEAENEALRRLSGTLKSHGVDWKSAADQVQEWGKAVQTATRFSDTEAFQSLDRMSRATKSLEEAQKASQIAMNLSVTTGKSLAETTELVAQLMQGNERAVMQANREFGNFAGGAKNAQEALDNLDKATRNASASEESFTKATSQLKAAFSDFQEDVGRGIIPGLTVMTGWLREVFDWVQKVATAFATLAAVGVTALSSIGTAMKEALTGNIKGARAELAAADAQIGDILVESAAKMREVETKKTQITTQEIEKRVRVHASASVKTQEHDKEEALKAEQIRQQLSAKLFQIGEQTLAKRRAQIDAEANATKLRIEREIQDTDRKNKVLLELERVRLAQQEELDDRYWLEFEGNVQGVYEGFVKGAADSFGKIAIEGGNMGAALTQVFRNMAEQFISAVAEMMIKWLAFKALTAAFGGGALGGFGGFFARGGDFIVDKPTAFVAGEAGAERVTVQPLGRNGGGAFGGPATGGGGGGGSVTVGDIHVNISLQKLDSNSAQQILDSMARELRAKSASAVKFALASKAIQDQSGTRSF